MGISILTNVASLGAQRNLNVTQDALAKNVGRLSSGLRINRAADDAAGLAVSEALKADIRSLAQAQRNTNDSISMTQVAEGALNEVHGILSRMRELAVQAANGTLGATERGYLHTEFTSLRSEIDRISDVTEFNGTYIFTGGLSNGVDFQVGIHSGTANRLTLSIAMLRASQIGSTTALSGGVGSAALSTVTGAQNALAAFDQAISQISTRRSALGAVQNRMESTIRNLSVSFENLSAANSRIRDVDVAEESGSLVRNQILVQAGVAVLGQANQLPATALSLLQ